MVGGARLRGQRICVCAGASFRGQRSGVRRCFWMGGLTVWAAQPTYRRVWGHASLGNTFDVYALKSILLHSEKNSIILKTIRDN